jgi:exodeoxyribonuclease V alpha subunit
MFSTSPVEFACHAFARLVAPTTKANPTQLTALQALIARCMQDAYAGHTWIAAENALRSQLQSLSACEEVTTPQLPHTAKPLVLWSNRLYLARYWSCEARLAAYLQQVLAPSNVEVASAQEQALVTHLNCVLPLDKEGHNRGQRAAVLHAMNYQLTVVSGGPGTGKTTTVKSLLYVFAATYPKARIALVAPTGKAASRLAQADQQSIADQGTLHSLLGKRPDGSVRFDASNRLEHDLVIVDEASMLDLVLADQVVAALKPTAKLVLLGDANQLDAVETGAFFHDLCSESPAWPEITAHWLCSLTHTFRFKSDSVIANAANALELNDGNALVAALAPRLLETNRQGLEVLAQGFQPYVEAVIEAVKANNFSLLFESLNKYRALVAVNEGRSGQKALAQELDNLLREKLNSVVPTADDSIWFVGQAILFTKNNALLNVNNGDVGIVLKASVDENASSATISWQVMLQDGRRINTHLLQNFTHAWVLTVHKAQGSEFDEVAFVMPGRPVEKALLYTAITRAKARFTAYGSPSDFAASANNINPRRASVIARLQNQTSALPEKEPTRVQAQAQASLFTDL